MVTYTHTGKPVCTRGIIKMGQALCKLKPLEQIMLPYYVRSSHESYTSPLSLADTFVPWGCRVSYKTESRFWQKPRELKIIFEIVPIISYPKTSLPVTGYQYPFCRLIHLVNFWPVNATCMIIQAYFPVFFKLATLQQVIASISDSAPNKNFIEDNQINMTLIYQISLKTLQPLHRLFSNINTSEIFTSASWIAQWPFPASLPLSSLSSSGPPQILSCSNGWPAPILCWRHLLMQLEVL